MFSVCLCVVCVDGSSCGVGFGCFRIQVVRMEVPKVTN